MLAEERVGRVNLFEQEYDDFVDPTGLDEWEDDRWKGWEWEQEVRDIVVFGERTHEAESYLYGEPDSDDEDADAAGSGSGNGNESGNGSARQGRTQQLRELTIVVRSPDDDGVTQDSVRVVLFVPSRNTYWATGGLRDAAPASGGSGGGGGGGGGGNGGR